MHKDRQNHNAARHHQLHIGIHAHQPHARFFRNRYDIQQEIFKPLPDFFVRHLGQVSRWRRFVNDHIPHCEIWDRRLLFKESNSPRFASGRSYLRPAPDVGDAEIIARARYPGTSHYADRQLDVFQWLLLFGFVKQDIVPVTRVEVLQSGQLQSFFLYLSAQDAQLAVGPMGAARGVAEDYVAAGLGHLARAKIIRQLRDDMCCASLFGKAKSVAIQRVTV